LEPLEERRMLAVLTVTTNQDVVDFADGQLSLREAIFVANTVVGADEIKFDFGHDGPETIVLTQGELVITDSLVIRGAGAALLTIDASGNDPTPDSTLEDGVNTNDGDGSRVFNVNDLLPLQASNVSIRGVTLTGADFLGDGGAIYSAENLTIVESTISGNVSTSRGAGVALTGGTLTITSSTIRENSTGGFGGGINVRYGALDLSQSLIIGNRARTEGGGVDSFHSSGSVSDSTIRENFARVAGGGLNARAGSLQITISIVEQNTSDQIGGGIANQGATLTLAESVVAANVTKIRGGGIAISSGSSMIANTTISGNRSDGIGGGIDAAGPLTIRHSTITDNIADSDRSGNGRGGGVFFASTNQLEVDHSIIAGNHDYSAFGADDIYKTVPAAPLLTATYTLIGNNTGSGLAESPGSGADQNGNWIGGSANGIIDPRLGPLAFNGGPVFLDGSRMLTHALMSDSPAVDAGDPLAVAGMDDVPGFDQRGMPWGRVVNGDDVPEARIDMGAVEWQANPLGGDYNFDGVVDAADYSVWRDTVGSTNDLRADGSSELTPGAPDGVVDMHDYAWWKANFGNVLGQGVGSREPGVGGEQRSGAGAAVNRAYELQATEGKGIGTDEQVRRGTLVLRSGVLGAGNRLQAGDGEGTAWQASSGTFAAGDRDQALVAWVARRSWDRQEAGGAGVVMDEHAAEGDESLKLLDEVFAGLGGVR